MTDKEALCSWPGSNNTNILTGLSTHKPSQSCELQSLISTPRTSLMIYRALTPALPMVCCMQEPARLCLQMQLTDPIVAIAVPQTRNQWLRENPADLSARMAQSQKPEARQCAREAAGVCRTILQVVCSAIQMTTALEIPKVHYVTTALILASTLLHDECGVWGFDCLCCCNNLLLHALRHQGND
jgi:hypothetical protein